MHSEKLDAAIAAFLQAQAEGKKPDPHEWLEQYPELADDLRAFFVDRAKLEQLVAPLRHTEGETIPPTGEWQPSVEPPTLAPGETSSPAVPVKVRYFGDYELLEEIARGGMGVVFKARQVSLNRIVALKMILAGQLAGEEEVQRFRTEAEAAANLDHPHIVPIYEVGEHQGQQYFSMKYIDGSNLSSLFSHAPQARCSVGDMISLLIPVAHAVHHAHQRGILHRDLKPSNILLDKDGQPHVTDFGLAKKVEDDSGMTRTGAIVGTPSYMAPEQAAAKKQLTTAVDVYSLGAILYEILTGQPPFQAATPLDTLMQVLDKDPEPPRKLNPSVDRDLETICLKCLEKEPGKRYGSAQALAEELERWQKGEPILARRASAGERLVKWCRRYPAVAALIVISTLAAVVASALAVWAIEAEHTAREEATAALTARTKAETAQEAEKEQRLAAQQAVDRAETTLYFNRINLALQYWQGHNLKQTRDILATSPEKLRHWEWHYLHRLTHGYLYALPGGNGQFPQTLHFSKDGTRMASVSPFGYASVRVWDMTRRQPVSQIGMANGGPAIACAALHPEGTLVVIGDTSREISLWSATGQRQKVLSTLPRRATFVAFNPDGRLVAATCDRGPFFVWNVADGKLVFQSPTGVGDIVQFSPDGKWLLTFRPLSSIRFSSDTPTHQLSLWNTATWQEETNVKLGPAGSSWAFSPDSKTLAVGSQGGSFHHRVWLLDLATGQTTHTFPVTFSVGDLAFSPDGRFLAVSSKLSNHLEIYNPKEKRLLRSLRGHTDIVNGIAFAPDGKLFSCGWENQIFCWDPTADQAATAWPERGSMTITEATFNSDGSQAIGVQGNQVRGLFNPERLVTLVDVVSGKITHQLHGHADRAIRVASAARSPRFVTGSGDGAIFVWEGTAGKLLGQHRLYKNAIEALAISPDGQWVASAEEPPEYREMRRQNRGIEKFPPGEVKVWNAATGAVKYTLPHNRPVERIVFSLDGRWLACGDNAQLKVWDVTTGQERWRATAEAEAMGFSPDGTILLTAVQEELQLWDVATGKKLHSMRGHAGRRFSNPAFTPDGRRVATAAGREVKLWDVATGQEILTLPMIDRPEQNRGVAALRFSTDGKRLLAVHDDGTFHAWETEPQKE